MFFLPLPRSIASKAPPLTRTLHLPFPGTPSSSGSTLLDVPCTLPTDFGSPVITSIDVVCATSSIASPSCTSIGAGVYTLSLPTTASPLVASFSGLPGDSYVCFAGASNVAGTSCSTPSASTVVSGPPSAPVVGTATAPSVNTLYIPFTASTSPGNPPISNYTVKCVDVGVQPAPTCAASGAGVVSVSVPASQSPLGATLTGLTVGTTWQCFAIAINGVSGEQCSAASNAVVVVGAPPSAPSSVVATTPSAGTLSISFAASTYLGSPAITSYTVACVVYNGTEPSCGESGLAETVPVGGPLIASFHSLMGGARYACIVTASNGIGGPQCSTASTPVTITAPPSAPSLPSPPVSPATGALVVALTASS